MTLPRPLLRDQRGSALLISLVMIVVITILGLALFELGQIEGQQAGASLGDARAFELAQAGMERAIRELSNGFLADAYGSESWVDGVNRPTCTPACETAVYRAMNLTAGTNTLPAAGVNPLTGQDPGGTFTIEVKQVTVAEANNPVSQGVDYTYPHGQTCIPSANPAVCANLMFVRSTGTVAAGFPPGYQAVRTVQALVKAYSTSYFAGGLTAEKASGACSDPAVDGRVLIAGSVHILGCTNISPAFRIDGGMGMRNNWEGLWPDTDLAGVPTLARLTPRQLICPTGANCGGGLNLVESLEAELKVYGNVSNTMVALNGNTDLGISTVTTAGAYGDATVGSRFGKGRIDGVYVADGCPMPCTSRFSFGGSSTIYVDTSNYTKPYPYRPPKLPLRNQIYSSSFVLYPTVADGTTINGTAYANWYAGFFVFNTNAALNPALQPITFQPLGVQLTDARLNAAVANGGYCGPNYASTDSFGGGFSSLGGMTDSPLVDFPPAVPGPSINGFCHTFKFVNKAGAVQVGEICWRRGVIGGVAGIPGGNNTANMYPGYNFAFPGRSVPTLEFGSPSCDVPTDPSNPLLIHHANTWRLGFTLQPPRDYEYRGSALIFTETGVIYIENTLQTTCTASPCGVDATGRGQRFPENNLLILINRQSTNVNIAINNVTQPVNRFMGYVYSEGAIRTQFLSNLVGSLRAQQLCFNNSSPTSGCAGVAAAGGDPRFYQASFPDPRRIPAELPASSGDSGDRWLVNVVPRFWIECRRGPGDTLPTTPTGTCQYQ